MAGVDSQRPMQAWIAGAPVKADGWCGRRRTARPYESGYWESLTVHFPVQDRDGRRRRVGEAMVTTATGLVEQEGGDLADFLETLTPQRWDAESLCQGWRVRDVAAHVVS